MRSDVWAEIDLAALAHNISQLRSVLEPATRMMAVVKANAYGHGLLPVAGQVLASGADCLGVARHAEALQLRQAGIEAPVLIFGYTPPALTPELVANDLSQTVCSYETARQMAAQARKCRGELSVQIKVDTGMGRLGIIVPTEDPASPTAAVDEAAVAEIRAIQGLSGLQVKGIYTHFATADHSDKTYARGQFRLFKELMARLAGGGTVAVCRHAANSAAIIDMPDTHMDMVRAGIAIYGLYPSAAVSRQRLDLRPVMAVKARVIHLKKVDAGFAVSYGAAARTSQPTTIATVSIGYADGYNRLLSCRGRMLVRGRSAPVIGRVCMDQTMLDVGHIDGVEIGDEVVVFGRDGGQEVAVAEIAEMLGTISYEVVSGISDRVERIICHPPP